MASVKEQLSQLGERLSALEKEIPERAAGFHVARNTLLEQIRSQEGSWMPWQRQESHRLLKEGRDLTQLADALSGLLGECDALVQRSGHVEMLASTCPDPVLAEVTRERARVWKTGLSSLGSSARIPDDLAPDWDAARDIRAQLDASARFIPLFAEAVAIEERLKNAGNLGAAVVAADIERWRREYVTEAPSAERASEAERVLAEHRGRLAAIGETPPPQPVVSREEPPSPPPVVHAPRRPPPPPPAREAVERAPAVSLFAVSQLLRECRDWADAETGDVAVVRPLQERHRQLNESAVKDPAEVERLGADVTHLRDSLRSRVIQKAAAERQRMETRVRLFDAVCGRHSELEKRLTEVLSLGYETPDEYFQFQDGIRKLSDYFMGVANVDHACFSLNQGVADRAAALRARIANQKRHKRTASADKALDVISTQVPSRSDPPPLAAVSLDALEVCERLDVALRDLTARCAQDIRALELERDQLALRIRKLIEAGEHTGSDSSGLATLETNLAQISDWPENALIDDCRQQLDALASQVARYDEAIRRESGTLLREAKAELAAARRELALLNRDAGPEPSFPADPPDDLAALVTVLAGVGELKRSLGGALNEAETDLRNAIPPLRERLSGILADAGFQQQANRVIADDMVAELEHLPKPQEAVTPDSVAALRRWVRQCDDFFYSLERDRNQILEDARALRERALLIRREGRHEYRPDLHEQALALIEGIDPLPASLEVARHQLNRAKSLLDAIERDSLRLLVHTVLEATEALKRDLAASRDATFIQRGRSLLEELQSLGDDEIVPAATRRSLFLLTGRGAGGGRR
jgi:hypothetical protein